MTWPVTPNLSPNLTPARSAKATTSNLPSIQNAPLAIAEKAESNAKWSGQWSEIEKTIPDFLD